MVDLGPYNQFLQGIYVDMDSLFDTRFAVLEQVDPILALHNLKNGWNNREQDVFEGIDKKLFDELYETRDNSVLAIAPGTQIIDAIRMWVVKALQTIAGSPNGDKVVIFANVWPYQITRDHAKTIGQKILEMVGETVEVRMINVDIKQICTQTAKRYFAAMFMYEWDTWLESNTLSGSFEKQRIPDVTLYSPKLFKKSVLTDEARDALQQHKASGISVFDHFEMVAGPQIGIEFIEVAFYSHHMPTDYLDHYEEMRAAMQPAS